MQSNHHLHILFHRGTAWQSTLRCSTNIYAKMFVDAGYHVSYMQGSVHAGHLIKGTGNRESWVAGPRWRDGGYVFTPFQFIPHRRRGLFSRKWAAKLSYLSSIPSIRSLVRKSGLPEPHVIWTTRPGSGAALRSVFPRALVIFQVVDYYPAYNGEHVKELERQDYKCADHIFLIGHALIPYLTNELDVSIQKITVLGQGAHSDHYRDTLPEPIEIRDLSRPRAIWVGLMTKGDIELFRAAAVHLQKKGGSLILIGPEARWANELAAQFANVHFLGPRSQEIVPSFLCHSDIGLMLYNRSESKIYLGQNPLKLYEYTAAGLPVISTPHSEFKYLNPPVIVVCQPGDIAGAIDDALDRREILRINAHNFAREHTWLSRFHAAEQIILRGIDAHSSRQ